MQQQSIPQEVRLIRQTEVLQRTSLSRTTLYRMIVSGRFPKPLRIGAKLNVWPEREIDAWLHAKAAER